jgi:hypothetical protein
VHGGKVFPHDRTGSGPLVFATILWALIPVLSFGLLAFLPSAHAAVKLPNRRMWLPEFRS